MSVLEYSAFYDHKREHGDFILEVLSHLKQFKEKKELQPEKFVYFFN
jgi:hemerythrin